MKRRLFLGLVLMGLSACGGARASSDASASVGALREVHFVAKDFSFEGPDTIEAGTVTFVLSDEGETLHDLQLMRLPDGMTMDDFRERVARRKPGSPPTPGLVRAGGVGVPPPGGQARVTLTLQPGLYAVLCNVDFPDHVVHAQKGMLKALVVTSATTRPAPLPESDLALTMVDYAFSFTAPPTTGTHVARVVNAATQRHELILWQLLPGKSVEDLTTWLETLEGPAPGVPFGGLQPLESGQSADVYLTLTPGRYAALCDVTDATDGRLHRDHGMILTFTVS